MKFFSKIIAILLFILFFDFALNNTHQATLHLFMGYEFPGPLVMILLIFLIIGMILGIFSMLPTFFRQRRELSKIKKMLQSSEQEIARLISEPDHPPQADRI